MSQRPARFSRVRKNRPEFGSRWSPSPLRTSSGLILFQNQSRHVASNHQALISSAPNMEMVQLISGWSPRRRHSPSIYCWVVSTDFLADRYWRSTGLDVRYQLRTQGRGFRADRHTMSGSGRRWASGGLRFHLALPMQRHTLSA